METKTLSSKTLIAIPVYNAEAFIARTIDSCLKQTVQTQIWVVDNKSTDRTREIVFKYAKENPNVKLIVNEKNLGRIGNWNRCLELFEESEMLYIKFVFSGDEIFPDCVAETEKAFAIDPEIGAIAFPYEFVERDGSKVVTRHDYSDKLFSVKEITRVNIEDGGLLGAIICNVYSKKWIRGYRFSEFFVGKSDFDFEVLSHSKAYYLDKVLARFNLEARMTFNSAANYVSEAEFVLNRAYHLERTKSMFTEQEYERMRERLFLDFTLRNMPYYPISTFRKLLRMTLAAFSRKKWDRLKQIIKKQIHYGK